MLSWLVQSKERVNFRLAAVITIAAFCISIFSPEIARLTPSTYAAVLPYMAQPNKLLSTTANFKPVNLKGLKVYPDNPFKFDFLIDEGQVVLKDQELQSESSRLIRYFLAGLTIPKEDLWVNLSPYEHERVVPQALGETDAGRDLLGQDYVLKQLTASLIYPESVLGKKFWEKIHAKAQELYGASNIPVDTFNKIWIIPGKITVYEDGNTAIIGEAKLKVMMEADYVAMQRKLAYSVERIADSKDANNYSLNAKRDTLSANFATEIMREVVLPAIEEEVNNGKQFAILRQVYHALILANWLKLKLAYSVERIADSKDANNYSLNAKRDTLSAKNTLLDNYIDQRKISGVNVSDPAIKEKIYQQYVRTVQKGVYKYMRHESDPFSGKKVWRQYYSGGADLTKGLPDQAHPALTLAKQPLPVQAAIKAGTTTQASVDLTASDQTAPSVKSEKSDFTPASGVEKIVRNTAIGVLGMVGMIFAGQSGDQHTAINAGLIIGSLGLVAGTAALFLRNMLAGKGFKPPEGLRWNKDGSSSDKLFGESGLVAHRFGSFNDYNVIDQAGIVQDDRRDVYKLPNGLESVTLTPKPMPVIRITYQDINDAAGRAYTAWQAARQNYEQQVARYNQALAQYNKVVQELPSLPEGEYLQNTIKSFGTLSRAVEQLYKGVVNTENLLDQAQGQYETFVSSPAVRPEKDIFEGLAAGSAVAPALQTLAAAVSRGFAEENFTEQPGLIVGRQENGRFAVSRIIPVRNISGQPDIAVEFDPAEIRQAIGALQAGEQLMGLSHNHSHLRLLSNQRKGFSKEDNKIGEILDQYDAEFPGKISKDKIGLLIEPQVPADVGPHNAHEYVPADHPALLYASVYRKNGAGYQITPLNDGLGKNIAEIFSAPQPLPAYVGSGDTAIHKALYQAEAAVKKGDGASAARELEALIKDLEAAQRDRNIVPLMDEWNRRMSTDMPVDLLFDDIPAALRQAEDLLAQAQKSTANRPVTPSLEPFKPLPLLEPLRLPELPKLDLTPIQPMRLDYFDRYGRDEYGNLVTFETREAYELNEQVKEFGLTLRQEQSKFNRAKRQFIFDLIEQQPWLLQSGNLDDMVDFEQNLAILAGTLGAKPSAYRGVKEEFIKKILFYLLDVPSRAIYLHDWSNIEAMSAQEQTDLIADMFEASKERLLPREQKSAIFLALSFLPAHIAQAQAEDPDAILRSIEQAPPTQAFPDPKTISAEIDRLIREVSKPTPSQANLQKRMSLRTDDENEVGPETKKQWQDAADFYLANTPNYDTYANKPVAEINMGDQAPGFSYQRDDGTWVIVVNKNSGATEKDQAKDHENREISRINEGKSQHEAHIITSAEQAIGQMNNGGQLLVWHDRLINQLLTLDEINALIAEHQAGRAEQRKVLGKAGFTQDALAKIVAYEANVRAALDARAVVLRAPDQSNAPVPAAPITIHLAKVAFDSRDKAAWEGYFNLVSMAKDFLSDVSAENFLEMLRNISGDNGLDWSSLSRDVQLSYVAKGTNKYVYKVEFLRTDGKKIVIKLATKIAQTEDSISAIEVQNLKKLNGKNEAVPRFGGVFRTASGKTWYIEEFIDGKTIEEAKKLGRFTKPIIKGIIASLMTVTAALGGAAPRDIHGENFMVRNKDRKVVMVDIGDRRLFILGKSALAKHQVLFLGILMVQYGKLDDKNLLTNQFILDAIARDPSLAGQEGLDMISNAYAAALAMGKTNLVKLFLKEGRNMFWHLGARKENMKPLENFTDVFLESLRLYLAKTESRRGPPAKAAPAQPRPLPDRQAGLIGPAKELALTLADGTRIVFGYYGADGKVHIDLSAARAAFSQDYGGSFKPLRDELLRIIRQDTGKNRVSRAELGRLFATFVFYHEVFHRLFGVLITPGNSWFTELGLDEEEKLVDILTRRAFGMRLSQNEQALYDNFMEMVVKTSQVSDDFKKQFALKFVGSQRNPDGTDPAAQAFAINLYKLGRQIGMDSFQFELMQPGEVVPQTARLMSLEPGEVVNLDELLEGNSETLDIASTVDTESEEDAGEITIEVKPILMAAAPLTRPELKVVYGDLETGWNAFAAQHGENYIVGKMDLAKLGWTNDSLGREATNWFVQLAKDTIARAVYAASGKMAVRMPGINSDEFEFRFLSGTSRPEIDQIMLGIMQDLKAEFDKYQVASLERKFSLLQRRALRNTPGVKAVYAVGQDQADLPIAGQGMTKVIYESAAAKPIESALAKLGGAQAKPLRSPLAVTGLAESRPGQSIEVAKIADNFQEIGKELEPQQAGADLTVWAGEVAAPPKKEYLPAPLAPAQQANFKALASKMSGWLKKRHSPYLIEETYGVYHRLSLGRMLNDLLTTPKSTRIPGVYLARGPPDNFYLVQVKPDGSLELAKITFTYYAGKNAPQIAAKFGSTGRLADEKFGKGGGFKGPNGAFSHDDANALITAISLVLNRNVSNPDFIGGKLGLAGLVDQTAASLDDIFLRGGQGFGVGVIASSIAEDQMWQAARDRARYLNEEYGIEKTPAEVFVDAGINAVDDLIEARDTANEVSYTPSRNLFKRYADYSPQTLRQDIDIARYYRMLHADQNLAKTDAAYAAKFRSLEAKVAAAQADWEGGLADEARAQGLIDVKTFSGDPNQLARGPSNYDRDILFNGNRNFLGLKEKVGSDRYKFTLDQEPFSDEGQNSRFIYGIKRDKDQQRWVIKLGDYSAKDLPAYISLSDWVKQAKISLAAQARGLNALQPRAASNDAVGFLRSLGETDAADRLEQALLTEKDDADKTIIAITREFFTVEGSLFTVSPRLAGRSLRQELDLLAKEKNVDRRQKRVAALTASLNALLDDLHALGIIHRDLKPENLWVFSDGTVGVLDFEAAAIMAGLRTTFIMPVVTPGYGHPFQMDGLLQERLKATPADLQRFLYGQDEFSRRLIIEEMETGVRVIPAERWNDVIDRVSKATQDLTGILDVELLFQRVKMFVKPSAGQRPTEKPAEPAAAASYDPTRITSQALAGMLGVDNIPVVKVQGAFPREEYLHREIIKALSGLTEKYVCLEIELDQGNGNKYHRLMIAGPGNLKTNFELHRALDKELFLSPQAIEALRKTAEEKGEYSFPRPYDAEFFETNIEYTFHAASGYVFLRNFTTGGKEYGTGKPKAVTARGNLGDVFAKDVLPRIVSAYPGKKLLASTGGGGLADSVVDGLKQKGIISRTGIEKDEFSELDKIINVGLSQIFQIDPQIAFGAVSIGRIPTLTPVGPGGQATPTPAPVQVKATVQDAAGWDVLKRLVSAARESRKFGLQGIEARLAADIAQAVSAGRVQPQTIAVILANLKIVDTGDYTGLAGRFLAIRPQNPPTAAKVPAIASARFVRVGVGENARIHAATIDDAQGIKIIKVNLPELARNLADFERFLGPDVTVEQAARFVDGHESFHAFIKALGISLHWRTEERLANIFGTAFANGKFAIPQDLKDAFADVNERLKKKLSDQNQPALEKMLGDFLAGRSLEGILNAVGVNVQVEFASPLQIKEIVKAARKEKRNPKTMRQDNIIETDIVDAQIQALLGTLEEQGLTAAQKAAEIARINAELQERSPVESPNASEWSPPSVTSPATPTPIGSGGQVGETMSAEEAAATQAYLRGKIREGQAMLAAMQRSGTGSLTTRLAAALKNSRGVERRALENYYQLLNDIGGRESGPRLIAAAFGRHGIFKGLKVILWDMVLAEGLLYAEPAMPAAQPSQSSPRLARAYDYFNQAQEHRDKYRQARVQARSKGLWNKITAGIRADEEKYLYELAYQDAIRQFRGQLRQNPRSDQLYGHIGESYLGLGRYARAASAFRQAARLSQEYQQYYRARDLFCASLDAYSSRGRANQDAAVRFAFRALELDPSLAQRLPRSLLAAAQNYGTAKQVDVAPALTLSQELNLLAAKAVGFLTKDWQQTKKDWAALAQRLDNSLALLKQKAIDLDIRLGELVQDTRYTSAAKKAQQDFQYLKNALDLYSRDQISHALLTELVTRLQGSMEDLRRQILAGEARRGRYNDMVFAVNEFLMGLGPAIYAIDAGRPQRKIEYDFQAELARGRDVLRQLRVQVGSIVRAGRVSLGEPGRPDIKSLAADLRSKVETQTQRLLASRHPDAGETVEEFYQAVNDLSQRLQTRWQDIVAGTAGNCQRLLEKAIASQKTTGRVSDSLRQQLDYQLMRFRNACVLALDLTEAVILELCPDIEAIGMAQQNMLQPIDSSRNQISALMNELARLEAEPVPELDLGALRAGILQVQPLAEPLPVLDLAAQQRYIDEPIKALLDAGYGYSLKTAQESGPGLRQDKSGLLAMTKDVLRDSYSSPLLKRLIQFRNLPERLTLENWWMGTFMELTKRLDEMAERGRIVVIVEPGRFATERARQAHQRLVDEQQVRGHFGLYAQGSIYLVLDHAMSRLFKRHQLINKTSKFLPKGRLPAFERRALALFLYRLSQTLAHENSAAFMPEAANQVMEKIVAGTAAYQDIRTAYIAAQAQPGRTDFTASRLVGAKVVGEVVPAPASAGEKAVAFSPAPSSSRAEGDLSDDDFRAIMMQAGLGQPNVDHTARNVRAARYFADQEGFTADQRKVLIAAMWLHDISKDTPLGRYIPDDLKNSGILRMLAHHIESAKAAEKILYEAGYGADFIGQVKGMILHHMGPVEGRSFTVGQAKMGFMEWFRRTNIASLETAVRAMPESARKDELLEYVVQLKDTGFIRPRNKLEEILYDIDMLDLATAGVVKVVTDRQTNPAFGDKSGEASFASARGSAKDVAMNLKTSIGKATVDQLLERLTRFQAEAVNSIADLNGLPAPVDRAKGFAELFYRYNGAHPLVYDAVQIGKPIPAGQRTRPQPHIGVRQISKWLLNTALLVPVMVMALFAQPADKPVDTGTADSYRAAAPIELVANIDTRKADSSGSIGSQGSAGFDKGGVDLQRAEMEIKKQTSDSTPGVGQGSSNPEQRYGDFPGLSRGAGTPGVGTVQINPATFKGFTFKIISMTRNQKLGKILEG